MANVYVYEDVNPTLIENTTMQRVLRDGVHLIYRITPNEDYVLHDKALDYLDPEDLTITIPGYTTATCTCAAAYDFTENAREFYAVLAADVPADQIFGANNEHETI